MLNGSTLKYCFLMIVATFCTILIGLSVGVAFKVIEIPMYVQLMGELGISGLFGSIIQAFIHSNMADSNKEAIQSTITQQTETQKQGV